MGGHQMEIGPPVSGVYEEDFPPLLKQALFMHFVDCRIPLRIDTETDADAEKTCDLCRKYMVAPSRWKKCSQHKFCKRCILQWASMIGNTDIGTMKPNHQENVFNLGTSKAFPEFDVEESAASGCIVEIILPERCPLYFECKCQEKLKEKPEIEDVESVDPQRELPMSVYQQLEQENES